MTNWQLLEAIGLLDDETIRDAEQEPAPRAKPLSTPRAKRLTRQLTAIAACICLLFGGTLLAQMGGWGMKAADSAPVDGVGTEEPGGGMSPTMALTSITEPSRHDTTAALTTAGAAAEATANSTTHPPYTTTRPPYTTTTAWTYATTTAATTGVTPTHENTDEQRPDIIVPAEGLLVFEEDFNGYADTELTADISSILAWTKLAAGVNGMDSESDVAFAIRGGRLYFDNYDTAEDTFGGGRLSRGKDSYYTIDLLNDDYMKAVVMLRYTLEYDLEYTNAADADGYAALITEISADRQCYTGFFFRINGTAQHRCYFYGSWKAFSVYDPATDMNPAADDPTGAEGTPLVKKLLGLELADVAAKQNFAGVRVTIRLQWDPEWGHRVYMKTADMASFIQVSDPTFLDDGPMYIGWKGYAVGLKIGGAVEGYLDRIRIWTGWSDSPSDQWYQPVTR